MSRTTTFISLSAAGLTLLLASCGTEGSQSEPMTTADKVAARAQADAGEILDASQRRRAALYWSDRAMSDVWQRHPELIGR